jgi:hypothetical protein
MKIAALATVLAAAVFGTQSYAQMPPVQHQGNVEYVSGGIALDESTAFKEAMSNYPLAMTFASRIGDHNAYASDVKVVIRDRQDQSVLDVTSDGPYLLVKLPPGKYHVSATYENKTQSEDVSVGATGTRQIVFEWRQAQ